MQRRRAVTAGGKRDLWLGAEEGASRSCTETSSFLPRQLQMLHVHISGESVCYQVYGSVGQGKQCMYHKRCATRLQASESSRKAALAPREWRLHALFSQCKPKPRDKRRRKGGAGRKRWLPTFQLGGVGTYLRQHELTVRAS